MTESFEVIKIKGNNREIVEDVVVEEISLMLVVDGQELATILCSPADLEELAAGFLFNAGLIKKAGDIKKIVVDNKQWIVHLDLVNLDVGKDLAGRSKIVFDFKLSAAKINSLMADFQKKSEIYLKTGGAHSAALADAQSILIFREDIGRHNAIDKIIGAALKEGIFFQDKMIMTSGRISSEALLKAQKCQIPLIVSKSAPTNQAIKLAREMKMTLAGFARGNRMNVYSEAQRIT